MNIYLNNEINPEKLITFNGLPTILKIESPSTGGGEYASAAIIVNDRALTPESLYNEEYFIEINNVKIIGNENNVNTSGSNFLVQSVYESGIEYAEASAYTIAKALNTTELANNYNIYVDSQTNNTSSSVMIVAKEEGEDYNIKKINTNLDWVEYSATGGVSNSLLKNAEIIVDVHAQDNYLHMAAINGKGKNLPFYDTFSKRFIKDSISFNLSPILNNITEIGKIVEYNIVVSLIKNNKKQIVGILKHNYCVAGYKVNQGADYLKNIKEITLAQNVKRGSKKATYNNSTLYFNDYIYFSVFNPDSRPFQYTVNYLDSAFNQIKTETKNVSTLFPLSHITLYPDARVKDARYVDIVLPTGTVRYTKITPKDYVSLDNMMTLIWYNSYGGQSFFPFSKKKEESRESEKILYKKNNFDYYSDNYKSYNKVYENRNEYEVTLQTHYMDKSGTYLLNDLLNSQKVWTIVDGVAEEVIILSVEIEEQENNDVYVGTIKFKYSLADRF